MATARPNSYSANSGRDVFGGYLNPVWLQNTENSTWGEMPLGTKLSEIDPEDNPAINPNHPAAAPWRANIGQRGVIDVWCGGCFDSIKDTLHLPLGGGHADYAGNEPYSINIRAENPDWLMLRNPSGAIGNIGVLDDGGEATGVYFDGRPRAIHSYNKPVYVPNDSPYIAVQGTTYKTAAAGTLDTLRIDEVTGEATRFSAAISQGTSSAGGACYDPSRHCIWWRPAGTTAIQKYDIATDSWVQVGSNQVFGQCSLTYVASHDCVFLVGSAAANGFAVFDCANETWHEPPVSGVFVGTAFGDELQLVDMGTYLAGWDNTSDTTIINTLTIPVDPYTGTWVIGQLPVDASNTVTPTVRTLNGTYGRFFYSKTYRVFGVINAVDENIFYYKVA